jgi:hypothetical protein
VAVAAERHACTFAPVLMVMMAIERIGAPLASQAGMVGPLSTIALGVLDAGRALHRRIAAGTLLVLAGMLAARTLALTSRQEENAWIWAARQVGAGVRGQQGAGQGLRRALVREGVNVVITARGDEALQATAAELRALNPAVRCARWPATSPRAEGRAAALAACPQVDILVNNAGGPPPGDFRDWDREAWIKALDANMLTPIELIKATVDAMAERGFGRVVNITSAR